MPKYNVHEAKTQLSKLLERVAAGEEVIIAKSGVPVARLVPASPPKERPLGTEKGRVFVADDFDAPLPRTSSKPSRSEGPPRHPNLVVDARGARTPRASQPKAPHQVG